MSRITVAESLSPSVSLSSYSVQIDYHVSVCHLSRAALSARPTSTYFLDIRYRERAVCFTHFARSANLPEGLYILLA